MIATILQAAPPAGGTAGGLLVNIMPLVIIFVIFWLLLIRPQQKRMKTHQAKIAAVIKGDTIVTNGGLVGRVTKAGDDDLTVDFSGTKMTVMRAMVADVRGKDAPANDRK